MTDVVQRICSKNPDHPLGEAARAAAFCPSCGAKIVARTIETGASIPSRPGAGSASPLPAPALVCGTNSTHDLRRIAPGAATCPHPNCGGPLLQLECEADLRHDVAGRRLDQAACPVCGKGLVRRACAKDARHSLAARVAGRTACPVCNGALLRTPFVLDQNPTPPPTPARIPRWAKILAVILFTIVYFSVANHLMHNILASFAQTFAVLAFVALLIGASKWSLRRFIGGRWLPPD